MNNRCGIRSSQGRNVVLESKYGSPKIVNDGVTIAREVELEDPVENIGAKLVRQAAAKTNDTAGDGTTTATILSAAFINEGVKIVSAGTNPVQLIRGIEKTTAALVKELKALSTPLGTDNELANVAAVSAGNNPDIGKLIADAMAKVGRQGVVTMEESKTAEDNLFFVEGMQFDRGYYSPYFVTDPERMVSSRACSHSSAVHISSVAIEDEFGVLPGNCCWQMVVQSRKPGQADCPCYAAPSVCTSTLNASIAAECMHAC